MSPLQFLKSVWPVLLLCGLAGACKVGPEYTTPPAKVASKWTQQAALSGAPQSPADAAWWRVFNDPVLDELVATARRNNLSLQSAGIRVLEARAKLNQTIGKLFPQQQNLSAGVSYTRLNNDLASKIPGLDRDYFADQILFAATWEPDFWGKYRRGVESDRASYLASLASWEDALVTLTADVASTYVNLRIAEERRRVAEENVKVEREGLRIATAQFRAGETSERDVQQAKTQLAGTEAQIPFLDQAISQAGSALAVLLGETTEQVLPRLATPGRIPPVPTNVVVGIPQDLLRRRPDVRAAGYAAASKSALIGVARAAMYPSLSLSGQFGATGSNLGSHSLTDMFTWEGRAVDAGAGLVFPIFNYGRLQNQVRIQDAEFEAAILNYQNTVLVAQQEVESGLAAFVNQQRALGKLNEAVSAARRSTQLAMIQYKGGQADFTTVLSAQQAQLSVEDSLTSTEGNVVLGLISVYRALGGGWEIRDGGDILSEEVKAEMARRTDWGRLLEPSEHLPPEHARSQVQIDR